MRFDQNYEEEVVLSDGTRCQLRAVGPDLKDLFIEGMTRLSEESRYRRFFTPKSTLSSDELHYLTAVDHIDHVAIAAAIIAEAGLMGAGVARFVRVTDTPDTAEAAIVVVDDYQGRGLGRVLLERLSEAARERGIERFRAEVLKENRVMLELLRHLSPDLRTTETEEGNVIHVDLPLVAAHPHASMPPPMRILADIASGQIDARDILGRVRLLKGNGRAARD